MTGQGQATRVDWPGVVVVGGGISGLLVADRLRRDGVPTLLVEQSALAAGQTAHCHGYLHRGYIYRQLDAAQHAALRAGADWWDDLFDRTGHPALSRTSVIGMHGDRQRDETTARWRRHGMAYERTDPHPLLRRLTATYLVPEATVAPTDALRTATATTGRSPALHGRVVRLHARADTVTAVDVLTTGGPLTISAMQFVLAAGAGLERLLAPSGRHTVLRRRLSFMLVCHTELPLPPAFCLPADEAQGLFVASRPAGSGRRYLMSTFVNFWPNERNVLARALWLQGIGRVLAEHVPELWHDPHARWGLYPAERRSSNPGPATGSPRAMSWTSAGATRWWWCRASWC